MKIQNICPGERNETTLSSYQDIKHPTKQLTKSLALTNAPLSQSSFTLEAQPAITEKTNNNNIP